MLKKKLSKTNIELQKEYPIHKETSGTLIIQVIDTGLGISSAN